MTEHTFDKQIHCLMFVDELATEMQPLHQHSVHLIASYSAEMSSRETPTLHLHAHYSKAETAGRVSRAKHKKVQMQGTDWIITYILELSLPASVTSLN